MKPSPLTGQAGIMKTAHSGLIKIATCLPELYPDPQYGTSYVLYRANYNHWKILYPTFSVNSIFSVLAKTTTNEEITKTTTLYF